MRQCKKLCRPVLCAISPRLWLWEETSVFNLIHTWNTNHDWYDCIKSVNCNKALHLNLLKSTIGLARSRARSDASVFCRRRNELPAWMNGDPLRISFAHPSRDEAIGAAALWPHSPAVWFSLAFSSVESTFFSHLFSLASSVRFSALAVFWVRIYLVICSSLERYNWLNCDFFFVLVYLRFFPCFWFRCFCEKCLISKCGASHR